MDGQKDGLEHSGWTAGQQERPEQFDGRQERREEHDGSRDRNSLLDDRRDGKSRTAVETRTFRWTSSEEIRTACRRCWLEDENLKINTVLYSATDAQWHQGLKPLPPPPVVTQKIITRLS